MWEIRHLRENTWIYPTIYNLDWSLEMFFKTIFPLRSNWSNFCLLTSSLVGSVGSVSNPSSPSSWSSRPPFPGWFRQTTFSRFWHRQEGLQYAPFTRHLQAPPRFCASTILHAFLQMHCCNSSSNNLRAAIFQSSLEMGPRNMFPLLDVCWESIWVSVEVVWSVCCWSLYSLTCLRVGGQGGGWEDGTRATKV